MNKVNVSNAKTISEFPMMEHPVSHQESAKLMKSSIQTGNAIQIWWGKLKSNNSKLSNYNRLN